MCQAHCASKHSKIILCSVPFCLHIDLAICIFRYRFVLYLSINTNTCFVSGYKYAYLFCINICTLAKWSGDSSTSFCFVLVCKLISANFPNIFRPNLEPITKTYILTLLLRKQQTTITVAFSVDI